RRSELAAEDRQRERLEGRARKRSSAPQRLVERDAEAELIAGGPGRRAAKLLGAHVPRGPEHRPDPGQLGAQPAVVARDLAGPAGLDARPAAIVDGHDVELGIGADRLRPGLDALG